MIKFTCICGVDTGSIGFADLEYIKKNGGNFGKTCKKEGSKIIDIEPGKYKIKYNIPDSFVDGEVDGEVELDIDSGKLYVGDIGYMFSFKEMDHEIWHHFLHLTDYLFDMEPFGFSVDTGADGDFEINLEIEKIN